MYHSVTRGRNAGAQAWLKLSGTYVTPDTSTCPEAGYPDGCVWWVPFGLPTKRFVSNCDAFPAACGAAQVRPRPARPTH